MKHDSKHVSAGRVTAVAVAVVALVAALYAADDLRMVSPPPANPETPPASGIQSNAIPSNFSLVRIAQGIDPLENASGLVQQFGLLNDAAADVDKTRTEPDENTYLEFTHGLPGPDPAFNYGHHFLFQGHENGGDLAYITRINLDVHDMPGQPSHRITLLTPPDPVTGKTGFSAIDGSTWDPFAERLLFTEERGVSFSTSPPPVHVSAASQGRVVEVDPAVWPPAIRTLECVIGNGGWEGIHPDGEGNLILAEDAGGVSVTIDPTNLDPAAPKVAKQPNSFVYRFEPNDPSDLGKGGKLFALQVEVDGAPLVFGGIVGTAPFNDTYSVAQKDLRQPHSSWAATWVLVHDTGSPFSLGGCAAFDGNALAKAAQATPFKRPENLQFLPGSHFDTFFFDETGDTDARAGHVPELAQRGSWGSIFRVDFPRGRAAGRVRIVVVGDEAHASFDNLTFADGETLLAAEDRGDTLHDQLNAPGHTANAGLLDSVWAFDVVDGDQRPRRLVALGRDAWSASGEDNEPTGLHVSDGATSERDVLGIHPPSLVDDDHFDRSRPWFPGVDDDEHEGKKRDRDFRAFVTEQHGFNQVFEIIQQKGK